MCGISGILSLTGAPVTAAEIQAQTNAIIHRGPDQGGVFVSPGHTCGLGIRRLSIIDVAGGQQPLSNEDQSIHLVYNGETYNHLDLRRELKAAGHRPATRSDAEAVLHGYEQWGAAGVLRRLRGMVAFALWDEPRRQLVLARDRFGIKPLYTAQHAGRLYFASEIKAILADPAIPRRLNLPVLQAALTVGFVPGPATIFEGISKLPPAHFLLAANDHIQIQRYWTPDFHPAPPRPAAEITAEFLALLRESVRLRLMSEVPLGALLSGGLDSGALAALAQAESGRPLQTVSIGFEQAGANEAGLAAELAGRLETRHHPVTFSFGDFGDYPAVMRHLESPQCSATAVPIGRLYRACRAAGLTVALTGEGADELLGGYHWHRGDALARRLLGHPPVLRRLLARSPLPMSAAARRVLQRGHRNPALRYRDWLDVADESLRRNLFSAGVSAALPGENPLLAAWAGVLAGLDHLPPLQQMLALETQTRMVDFINFEVDKMSMAHSVEARVPFLDHKLWEFAAGLPAKFKLRGRTEKYLLRQAMRGILPEATRTRRKKGLASPYRAWLRAERLPDWAETALSAGELRRAGLFNPAAVAQLRRAHRAGQPGLGALLMGVLSTQVWLDVFGV
ncbi:MAG: asparagine synthase (glutamine-hydrolyzing) [Chloroflexi bacterium]|nr:MAG: asparagine synthase (glutamine-hydrolyzing) [Chloroflexota bacterium]